MREVRVFDRQHARPTACPSCLVPGRVENSARTGEVRGPRYRRRVPTSRVRLTAAVAALESAAVLWLVLRYAQPHYFFDLRIYRGALGFWTHGGSLYDYADPQWADKGFVYPPFAALCMLPMRVLPFQVTGAVLGVIDIGIVAIVATSCVRWLGWRPLLAPLLVPLLLALQPVHATIGYGQINLILLALVFFDVVALRRGWRTAGLGIGLATAIKITPGLFVVYLLLTRRWRAAATAGATILIATALGAAVDPAESLRYWTKAFLETRRVGSPNWASNQSLGGLLARLGRAGEIPTVPWLVAIGVVAGFGLWSAARAYRRGDDLTGFTVTALVALLVAPITWSHHMAWLVVAILLMVAWVLREARAGWRIGRALLVLVVYAAFVSEVVYHVPRRPGQHSADGGLGFLAENTYVLALLVVLLILSLSGWMPGSRSRHRSRRGAAEEIALSERAADREKTLPLPRRLNTFSHQRELE
jgi:alpha-1,2-mannosyltransferase